MSNKKFNILQVATTAKCNLDCSFCKGAVYMDQKDLPREKALTSLSNTLIENPQVDVCIWQGGEPLLAPIRLEAMLNTVKKERADMTHILFTNGRKLRLKNIELLKEFKSISISIDGYASGERTLEGFIDDGDLEALEVVHKLDNVRTLAVVTSKQLWNPRWYEDIVKLHTKTAYLGFTGFEIILDKLMEKPLFTDQVLNFTYGWKRLQENIERINNTHKSNVILDMPRFFRGYNCTNCSEAAYLEPDGTLNPEEDCGRNTSSDFDGCNMLSEVIGADAYKYLLKFLFPNGAQNV